MGDGVMVFAPAPVLTVTIEQQADALELHVHPGGQGVWEARMVASLGAHVTLCVAVGGEGVLSGPAHPSVVDPQIYRRLAADLGANGTRVVADLSGEHLAAALDGGVSFVKVSHEELIADGHADDDSVDALVTAARRLRDDHGAGSVLVSRADQPAIALLDDDVVEVHLPKLRVADHRGAGDSMTAGVAAVLSRGGDLHEAVRTGAAAGALNVTRHGLGTGRAEAVRELIGRVRMTSPGAK